MLHDRRVRIRDLLLGRPDLSRAVERVEATGSAVRGAARFSSIDPGVLYGTPTLDHYIYRTGRITRAEALRVPAVKRARDLIAGGIGQYPLKVYDPAGNLAADFSPSLFPQAEAGVAPSVTWTRVVEDMLLFGQGWLKVTALGWHGKPADSVRLDADTVAIQPEYRTYREGTAKVWPEVPGLIRFDSPNGGILDCSPAVRACIALDRATLNYVDGTPPIDYFTPAEDADPLEDDEVADFLDVWEEQRRTRGTAYVPAALRYNTGGWDPQKLQLREAREFAITEVARLTGIDPEDLSVPTTSRTYFNAQDRKRHRLEDTQGPYMTAIEGRASMPDVTPRGFTARFDTSAYLRLDDLSAAQADSVLIASQIITRDEARAKRGLEPLGEPAAPADPAAVDQALARAAAIRVEQIPTGAPRALPSRGSDQ